MYQKSHKGHMEKSGQIFPLCPQGELGWPTPSCFQAALLPALHLGASSLQHWGSALCSALHWCFLATPVVLGGPAQPAGSLFSSHHSNRTPCHAKTMSHLNLGQFKPQSGSHKSGAKPGFKQAPGHDLPCRGGMDKRDGCKGSPVTAWAWQLRADLRPAPALHDPALQGEIESPPVNNW